MWSAPSCSLPGCFAVACSGAVACFTDAAHRSHRTPLTPPPPPPPPPSQEEDLGDLMNEELLVSQHLATVSRMYRSYDFLQTTALPSRSWVTGNTLLA